jgi:hypothetical protein
MGVEMFGQKSVKVWRSATSRKESAPESEKGFVAGTFFLMKRFRSLRRFSPTP